MPGQFSGCTVSLNLSLLRLSKDQLLKTALSFLKRNPLSTGFTCCRCSWAGGAVRGAFIAGAAVDIQQWERDTWGSQSRPRRPLGICSTLPLPENLSGWKQPVGNQKHTHARDEKVWLGTCSSFWLLKSDRCQTLLIQTFTLARHATAASVMRARFSPCGVDATLLTKWCQILKYPR